jgi:hypothetical protein
MFDISTLTLLLFLHWVADFVMQSDKMAKEKSISNWQLTRHCLVYSIPFMFFGWQYALLNAGIHWCVDWHTSRITKILYAKGNIHYFFVVIGFDQYLHFCTLLLTFGYFFK